MPRPRKGTACWKSNCAQGRPTSTAPRRPFRSGFHNQRLPRDPRKSPWLRGSTAIAFALSGACGRRRRCPSSGLQRRPLDSPAKIDEPEGRTRQIVSANSDPRSVLPPVCRRQLGRRSRRTDRMGEPRCPKGCQRSDMTSASLPSFGRRRILGVSAARPDVMPLALPAAIQAGRTRPQIVGSLVGLVRVLAPVEWPVLHSFTDRRGGEEDGCGRSHARLSGLACPPAQRRLGLRFTLAGKRADADREPMQMQPPVAGFQAGPYAFCLALHRCPCARRRTANHSPPAARAAKGGRTRARPIVPRAAEVRTAGTLC